MEVPLDLWKNSSDLSFADDFLLPWELIYRFSFQGYELEGEKQEWRRMNQLEMEVVMEGSAAWGRGQSWNYWLIVKEWHSGQPNSN